MSVAYSLPNREKKTCCVERARLPSGSSTNMASRSGTWSDSEMRIIPAWSASYRCCLGIPDSARSSGVEYLYTGGQLAD